MNFTHTMIKTKNINKAIDFYTRIMDMKIVNQKEIGKTKLCFLANDNGFQLELMEDEKLSIRHENKSTIHLGFVIDETMDEFSKKIKAYGYDFSKNPFDITGKGSNIAFMLDEDGYEIEIIEKVVW